MSALHDILAKMIRRNGTPYRTEAEMHEDLEALNAHLADSEGYEPAEGDAAPTDFRPPVIAPSALPRSPTPSDIDSLNAKLDALLAAQPTPPAPVEDVAAPLPETAPPQATTPTGAPGE
jgi:hypothetical protein